MKRSFIDAEITFHTRDGQFSVRESQYASEGGRLIRQTAEGAIRRKRENGQYIWIYRDNAPGSTNVYGPAVNAKKPTRIFNRIIFGGPRNGGVNGTPCLKGISSDPKVS